MKGVVRWAALGEGAVISALCGLLVLGAFLPDLGWLGLVGTILVPVFASWFAVLSVLAALPAVLAIRLGFVRTGSAFVGVSALALAGAIVILAALLQAGTANGAGIDLLQSLTFKGPADARPDETHVYATRGDQLLQVDVYRPKALPATGRAPVILYIHGGGWFQGDRAANSSELRWFADRGYVVLSPEYTLATRTDHIWDVIHGQVACAMVWTANNAGELHADMQRFALGGDSAGGNLSINAAYSANQDQARSSCGGAVPHVHAVVTGSPILDPIGAWYNETVQGDAARSILQTYVGGSPEQYPDRYRAVSSFTYISPAAPPTLIVNGVSDHLIPHQGSVDFVRETRAAGVDTALVVLPYSDHDFDLTFGAIGHQIKLQAFDQFLRTHMRS
jgi:acetyl esterase/lipase